MTDMTADQASTRNTELGTAADRPDVANAPARTRARVGDVLQNEYTPPEIWRHGRPGLAETLAYAANGEQCPPAGAARAVMRVWAWTVLPVRAFLAVLDWIVERPSRMPILFALYAVTAMTPLGDALHLPWF